MQSKGRGKPPMTLPHMLRLCSQDHRVGIKLREPIYLALWGDFAWL